MFQQLLQKLCKKHPKDALESAKKAAKKAAIKLFKNYLKTASMSDQKSCIELETCKLKLDINHNDMTHYNSFLERDPM